MVPMRYPNIAHKLAVVAAFLVLAACGNSPSGAPDAPEDCPPPASGEFVDSVCGEVVNENYARFVFHGGAAVAQRREWRAHILERPTNAKAGGHSAACLRE